HWTDRYLQLGTTQSIPAWNSAAGSVPSGLLELWDWQCRFDVHDPLMGLRGSKNTVSADCFEVLLRSAVARRLEADVPLGCFLSGGVDSSLVAYFASRIKDGLNTFTVRMPDSRYDES